jgi:hypothetical protein
MWKANSASHIPTGPNTTAAVRYTHSQTKTGKLQLWMVEKSGQVTDEDKCRDHQKYSPF